MQLFTSKTLFFFGIIIMLVLSQHEYEWRDYDRYRNYYSQELSRNFRRINDSEILACKTPDRIWNDSMPLNYLGRNITSFHHENIILCPGDAFGDLNSTYFVIKNCRLEMYHKGKMIWLEGSREGSKLGCVFCLQQNGDLTLWILYEGELWNVQDTGVDIETETNQGELIRLWQSETALNPFKTELQIQDQQFQILQTLKDGTQKLFALSEMHPEFREYLGKPKKIGSSGFVKSHADETPLIFKSNEYIGDQDGLHLIMQDDCQLHLKKQNHTLWASGMSWINSKGCSLVIQEEKWVSMAKALTIIKESEINFASLMISHSFKVLESQFVLKDDQLFIIQTLEDGSKQIFESQPGRHAGLRLQKNELRQIAKNNITITKDDPSFIIERMDYIGNLTGLHLVLQDNCTLLLANGPEKLWLFTSDADNPFLECSITLNFGFATGFLGLQNIHSPFNRLARIHFDADGSSRQQIVLDNNHLIFIVDYDEKNISKKYYAGSDTHGSWSERISDHSLIVRAKDYSNLNIPKTGHIGDFNGVYLIFQEDCNWVLYNQSQILWELGTAQPDLAPSCRLYFNTDGTLVLAYSKFIRYQEDGGDDPSGESFKSAPSAEYFEYICEGYECYLALEKKEVVWSTENTTKSLDPLKKLVTSEISVHDDWLWLIYTYQDGTVDKFKALEGTNNFTAVKTMYDITSR